MQASAKSAVNGNESSSSSDDDSSDDFEAAAKSQSISQQMRRQLAGKTSTPAAAAATPPNKRHDVGGAGDASRLSLKKAPAAKLAKNNSIQAVASPNKRKVKFCLWCTVFLKITW